MGAFIFPVDNFYNPFPEAGGVSRVALSLALVPTGSVALGPTQLVALVPMRPVAMAFKQHGTLVPTWPKALVPPRGCMVTRVGRTGALG